MQSYMSRLNGSVGDSLVAAALDAVLKSTVLLLLAVLIAVLLRRSSAAVRHRMWCLAFAGLLLLPVLSYALPAWRIAILPPVEAALETPIVAEPASTEPMPVAEHAFIAGADASDTRSSDASPPPDFGMSPFPPEYQEIDPPGESTLAAEFATATPDSASEQPVADAATFSAPVVIAITWIAGVLLVLAPLCVGLLQSLVAGLRADRITNAEWIGLLQELCGRLQLTRRVTLLEMKQPVIPMTWGVVRPVVVVPQAAQSWPERLRRFVLLHELAHVKRWDVPLQLLGRVACAVYWFHPLAWCALRRLRIERELACDDYVVTTGERPSDYAEQLLQIVRTCRPAGLASVGVAMARTSHLEVRIRAMFDKARSHVPLSIRAARILSLAAALLVTTVAVVRPAARDAEPAAEEGTVVTDPTVSPDGDSVTGNRAAGVIAGEQVDVKSVSPAADQITLRGMVTDPQGQPVAGATVRAQSQDWAMLRPLFPADWKPPLSETKSDANGSFEISFSMQPYGDLSRLSPPWTEVWKKTAVAASAPGFGPAWITYEELQPADQPVVLKLVEDVPIQGRIVDLEGAPLAGETVRISGPRAAPNEDLSDWLAATSRGELTSMTYKLAPRSVDPRLVGIPESVTSDADGRFEIRGVGRERHLTLVFHSEAVACSQAIVATRVMEPIHPVASSPPVFPFEPVFGARFTFAATPARIVAGTVRDSNTGEPLAGVKVESHILASQPRLVQRVVEAVTDSDGRFRLAGMPKGDGNEILLVPNDDQPYLMRVIDVPNPDGLAPVDVTIDLHRGTWITGRVTDAATGEPVHARLYYLPYLTNTFAQALPEFDENGNVDGDQLRYQTRADGTYRLVGLPGPAVIGTESVLTNYPYGQGHAALPGPRRKDSDTVLTYHNPVNPSSKWPTAMTYVDPPADAETINVDFKLESGSRVAIRMVDPDGQPLTGVEVTGQRPRWGGTQTIDGSEFEAINFGTDEERKIVFQHKGRGLGWVQHVKPGDDANGPLVITLQPVATVTGRLLTADGDPMAGTAIVAWPLPSGDFARTLESIPTDAEGRFKYTLLPGVKYYLRGEALNVLVMEVAKELAIEPGQSLDLGDVRIGADGRAITKPDATPAKPAVMTKPEAGATASGTKQGTASAAEQQASITIHGRVLNPDGQPAANATAFVGLPRFGYEERLQIKPPLRVAVQGDGSFAFTFSIDDLLANPSELSETVQQEWLLNANVAATADGLGAAWSRVNERVGDGPLTLRLVPDLPIVGRLVSLEGAPVSHVKLRVQFVEAALDGDLQPWVDALKGGKPMWQAGADFKHQKFALNVIGRDDAFATDADGRFQIDGMGRDRIVRVILAGPQVARQSFRMISRVTEPLPTNMTGRAVDGEQVYGATSSSIVVAPSQPIVGIVRDADTQAPLAGVTIESYQFAGSNSFGSRDNVLRAVSDSEGRYRLDGMPKGKGNVLLAVPNDEQPYFMREIPVSERPGLDPIEVSIELHRGLWIEGRVVDLVTGAPVPANLHYLPFLDNEFALKLPEFTSRGGGSIDGGFGYQHRYQTRRDGTFRIVGLPGRAIVGAETYESDTGAVYRRGAGSENISGLNSEGDFATYSSPIEAGRSWPTVMVEVNPPADAQSVAVTLKADPGKSVRVRVADDRGNPVTGYRVSGKSESSMWSEELDASEFDVMALASDESRPLIILDEAKRLGRVIRVSAAEAGKQAVEARLEPLHRVRGRLLHSSGTPLTRVTLTAWTEPSQDFNPTLLEHPGTDTNGRFEFSGVPAGSKFRLTANSDDGKVNIYDIRFDADQGTEIDLGDLWINDDGEVMEKPRAAAVKAAAMAKPIARELAASEPTAVEQRSIPENSPHTSTIRGRVVTPQDRPVAGVNVAVWADRIEPKAGMIRATEVLGETTSNELGEYEVRLSDVSSKTHQFPRVVAWSDGTAIVWQDVNIDIPAFRATLTITPEQPLQLQFVDLEGQPAAGLPLKVTDVMFPPAGPQQPSLGLPDPERRPKSLFGELTTDNNGRVTIHNVGERVGVHGDIPGNDRFAPQFLILNTQEPEQRGERDGTYRGIVRNLKPGETGTIALEPAQVFEGRVMLGRGDQPAANARISMWSSQQQRGGSTVSVEGRTDQSGHFRFNPYPGVRFGIVASPPDGTAYHGRILNDLKWSSGEGSKSIEIRLPPGIVARGVIVDAESGAPLKSAQVQYEPDRIRNSNVADGILTGWQGTKLTNDAGEFELVVPPGPGTMIVHGPGRDYVLKAMGERDLYSGQPGGARVYAHAFEKIDPVVGTELSPFRFVLTPGTKVSGKVTDVDGKLVQNAMLISRLLCDSSSRTWRGASELVRDGSFEAHGLEPGVEYPLYFVDIRRKLGATAIITAETREPSVVLQPCGKATARYVDQDGQPIADEAFAVHIVVTPGKPRLVRLPMQGPEFLSDEDIYSNCTHVLVNGRDPSLTGPDGIATYDLLIPGATYRLYRDGARGLEVAAEFTVEPGETRDLGEIRMQMRK